MYVEKHTLKLESVSAAIERGKRPVPFRTRKLSLSSSMVLQGGPCGRVDRRRTSFIKASLVHSDGAFFNSQEYLFTKIFPHLTSFLLINQDSSLAHR